MTGTNELPITLYSLKEIASLGTETSSVLQCGALYFRIFCVKTVVSFTKLKPAELWEKKH